MQFAAVITDEAVTAANTETLVQVIAATNHPVKLLAWSVSFAGVGVTDEPLRVEIVRQTTAGTSSALTLVKWNDSDGDTLDASGLQDFTAEPTLGDILNATRVHPQAGYEIWYPEGKELKIGAGDRMGLRIITPSGVNPNVSGFMVCQE